MTVAQENIKTLPILRKGSTGDDVKYLQDTLNYIYGPDLKVDGVFGAKTEAAIKKFQGESGLVADGIVGEKTWTRLVEVRTTPVTPSLPVLRKGSTGEDVKYLQDLLNHFGSQLTVDRFFGVKTEAAVKTFQGDYGLVADGIVGAKTWDVLHQQFHD